MDFNVTATPAGSAIRPRPSLQDIQLRVQLLTQHDERSPLGESAALVLLAASSLGHNVDRLARFCGLSREVVARFARRLIDNGVWCGGDTVSRWSYSELEPTSFWRDVAVAEGRLCRRLNEEGEFEWAPQGYWWKHFEYVAPRDRVEPMENRYEAPVVPTPAEPLPLARDDEEASEAVAVQAAEAEEFAVPVAVERSAWVPSEQAEWLGETLDGSEPDEVVGVGGNGGVDDLFPEAVWLG